MTAIDLSEPIAAIQQADDTEVRVYWQRYNAELVQEGK